jgi:hypothetical protein
MRRTPSLTVEQLQNTVAHKDQIEQLEPQLCSVLGDAGLPMASSDIDQRGLKRAIEIR